METFTPRWKPFLHGVKVSTAVSTAVESFYENVGNRKYYMSLWATVHITSPQLSFYINVSERLPGNSQPRSFNGMS